MPQVVIVDYGLGNLFSVARAVKKVGAEPLITSDSALIRDAEKLILPGVGAFGDGMQNLIERGLVEPLRAYAASGKPMLGICLGMQLLLSESEEFGLHQGLDIITGRVVSLKLPETTEGGYKIPHIGWNSIQQPFEGAWKGSILEAFHPGFFVYFLHSFVTVPEDENIMIGRTSYGRDTFCSVFQRGNVIGMQHHPERSGTHGLNLIQNFIFGNLTKNSLEGQHDYAH